MDNKKSLQILSSFWLRIIAMVFMVIDHIGVLMINYQADIGPGASNAITVLRALGRIAFPLFIFMLAEGMHYTRNKWKYLARIATIYGLIIVGLTIYIFAIAKDPTLMHGTFPGTNPFTDLVLIGLTLLFLNSPGWKKLLALIPIGIYVTAYVAGYLEEANRMTITWFPFYLRPDYGLFGLAIALGFFAARKVGNFISKRSCEQLQIDFEAYKGTPDHQRELNLCAIAFFALITLAMWGLSYVVFDPYNMPFESYCLLAIPAIFFYSGKRGYNAKWFRIFSYSFFPVHLIILFLIFFVSFGHV